MNSAGRGTARHYAQAAFAVAEERHDVKGWTAALGRLAALLADDEVARVMESPRLDDGRRVALAISLAPTDLAPEQLNFLKLIVLARRTHLLPEVLEEFQALLDAAEGRVDIEVVSAQEMGKDDRDLVQREISDKLGRETRITVRVDPSIIGGLIIRQGDHVIDGSVRRRLQELREQLVTA